MHILRFSYVILCLFFSSVVCLLFVSNIDKQKVFGSTYYDVWFLGLTAEGQTPADAHVIYTYPDRVQAGKAFNVGVTLEYINDKSARSNWVLFSNVSINLRAVEHPNGPDLPNGSAHDTSRLIGRGEGYSHSFSLVAPNSSREKYLVFLTFNAFSSPEGVGSIAEFFFRASAHYNNSNGPGYIDPNKLPPITVIDKENQTSRKQGQLIVEIEKPYGYITPIKVKIDNANYYNLVNGIGEIPLASGSTHSVSVPPILDIVKDKIHAVFSRWSDGQGAYNRTVAVASNTDMDLFAQYKMQYYLSVKSLSLVDTYPHGSGWYDAGSEARYAVNPWPSFFVLQSFDHWIGDMGTSDHTVAAGSLAMDGPKEITALWKFDYGYLAIIIGLITGAGAILSKIGLIAKRLKK
jgi:hypothetical protein